MIEFKRDENGILFAYKDGKRLGQVMTMGDEINKEDKSE